MEIIPNQQRYFKMATQIPAGKHTIGRDLMVANPHRVAPPEKRQSLPLCVSLTWERVATMPTPILRLCISNKEMGYKIKLGRGLIRKGMRPACNVVYKHLVKCGYAVSTYDDFVEQVKTVIRKESVKHQFNLSYIPDFYVGGK